MEGSRLPKKGEKSEHQPVDCLKSHPQSEEEGKSEESPQVKFEKGKNCSQERVEGW